MHQVIAAGQSEDTSASDGKRGVPSGASETVGVAEVLRPRCVRGTCVGAALRRREGGYTIPLFIVCVFVTITRAGEVAAS